jgi:hypothetical protein
MGPDKMGPLAEGGAAQSRDLAFHAADIRDDGPHAEGWSDLMQQREDAVDRCRDHYDGGILDGSFRRIGDGIAEGLFA